MLGAAKAPPKLTQKDLGLNKGSKCISLNHYKKCSWHISWYFVMCNNCVEKNKFEKLNSCSYLWQMLAKLWDSLSKSSPNWRLTSQGVAKWFCKVLERWAGVVLGRLQSSGKFLAGWPGHQPGQQTRQENGKPSPPWTLELAEMPRHWQNIDFVTWILG